MWKSANVARSDDSRGLSGHYDAKRTLAHGELDRAISYQLAIQFYRHQFIAVHLQAPGLKILDLRRANLGTENDVLQIFDDLEVAEALENNHVKQAVIDHSLFEKGKWSAVK